MNPSSVGSLYIVSSPIGNLKDITFRAIEVLSQVELVLAEDTRQAGKLLSHYDIKTPKTSYHDYTSPKKISELLDRLEKGSSFALLSDSGTPLLSDPGYTLVHEAVEREIEIIPIPGASALLAALVSTGAAMDSFVFVGFLPPKGKARSERLERIAEELRTQVLYESPYKIEKLLGSLKDTLGADRQIVLCRELTKIHEEKRKGTIEELLTHYSERKPKGEFVVIIPKLPKRK